MPGTVTDLLSRKCKDCKPGTPALNAQAVASYLKELNGWGQREGAIEKAFKFKDYHGTMAFVNAVAWVAHQENHHPDLEVGYDKCVVRYSTHSVGGLSENDFICAAKVEALFT
jgi:4a-hydroxytetrahydrobiopterin dehydratase